jgi:hypothetical protein
MVTVLLAWVGASLWQYRQDLLSRVDRTLLLAAAMFGVGALSLPYMFMNTIFFAERWLPPALTLLLLALPAPALAPSLRRLVVVASVAALSLTVTAGWLRVERIELAGLSEALAALPERPRVIGLDYVDRSSVVTGRPFMQLGAYAQVLRGGELNFTFAEFAPMPVVYREPRARPWTNGLEWNAAEVKPADFGFFDFALIGGDAKTHAEAGARPELDAVTNAGVWRLYRVREPQP